MREPYVEPPTELKLSMPQLRGILTRYEKANVSAYDVTVIEQQNHGHIKAGTVYNIGRFSAKGLREIFGTLQHAANLGQSIRITPLIGSKRGGKGRTPDALTFKLLPGRR